ncbi:MAG: ATP-binding protein [Bacteroidota bacterium]
MALEEHFQKDIEDIQQIPGIQAMLDVICTTTGMGFSAVARVTDDRWITCSARDDVGFGLKPGDELQVKTTICNEIRDRQQAVVIDNVSLDPLYHDHHTPAMYGLQSYISLPIVRKNGSFFGTLCAIDPHPRELKSNKIIEMFTLFCSLISFHLDAIDTHEAAAEKLLTDRVFIETLEKQVAEKTQELKDKNKALKTMNHELEAFAYISSHDLQEPLRKIQTIASIIAEKEKDNLSESGKDYFKRMQSAAQRMQNLIKDLLTYSRTAISDKKFKDTSLDELLQDVKADLKEELQDTNIIIEANNLCNMPVIPFQFRQLLYNMVSNSIKFARPDVPAHIVIDCKTAQNTEFKDVALPPGMFTKITIKDNGIGFDPSHSDRIFNLFQRLHDREKIQGTGIGLAIVKKIVENHNGYIIATGMPNEGAVFDIYIPVQA